MMENTNLLQFKSELPKHPLFKEINEANKYTKRIKLHAKKSSSGKFILYLERSLKTAQGGKERYFLELHYLGNKNTKRKDKDTLALAIDILRNKDQEWRTNKHNFTFENKKVETGFIEYFKE